MTPQQSIGHYQIVSKIGEGGMGAVFRATDTRLKREVAIKFLPDAFSADHDRLARFAREAQVLAALNHPNIATIYGLEERALVMELVDGPTLADRIAQGPIPLEEALLIAKQIAEALEYAHERGVVHRDLKPANLKVTPEGRVKVLDFGLAKALANETGAGEAADSPTLTLHATMAGVILGTPGYMAPEQARGKPADRRADIWAFGVVLYEMLAGECLFAGETVTDILAAVMKDAPNLGALPQATPPEIRRLLRRCLERDSGRRLQAAGEARIVIGDYLANPAPEEAKPAPPASSRQYLAWISSAVLALALGVLAFVHFRQRAAELPVVRFTVGPPSKESFYFSRGSVGGFSLSPDGRRLVFAATLPEGEHQLWVRSLDSFTAQPLAGTEGANYAFWSPDSTAIGFGSDAALKKINIGGGPPITLAAAPNLRGGTWNSDGVILFSPSLNAPIERVSASGGEARPAARLDSARGESSQRFPWFLPDGRHYLFSSTAGGGNKITVRIGSLDSLDSTFLLDTNSNAAYAAGYLLYVRDYALLAQPFDAKRLAFTGEPVPLDAGVGVQFNNNATRFGLFSASANGGLAYFRGFAQGMGLTWFDLSGKRLADLGEAGELAVMNLSPDRKHAAVSVTSNGNTDIWIYDLVRSGLRTRFTFDPAAERAAIWSPDGRSIVFDSSRNGKYQLYRKSADGAGSEELLYTGGIAMSPSSWSPDGRYLLYHATDSMQRIWVLPLTPQASGASLKPYVWLDSRFTNLNGQFSPDGRWVSYQSTESGRNEVYVAPFPGPGARQRISTGGGVLGRWRPDGKQISYVAIDRTLVAVDVNAAGKTVEVGESHRLFGGLVVGLGLLYDVAAGGQKMLAVVPRQDNQDRANEDINVVLNWTAGLKK